MLLASLFLLLAVLVPVRVTPVQNVPPVRPLRMRESYDMRTGEVTRLSVQVVARDARGKLRTTRTIK